MYGLTRHIHGLAAVKSSIALEDRGLYRVFVSRLFSRGFIIETNYVSWFLGFLAIRHFQAFSAILREQHQAFSGTFRQNQALSGIFKDTHDFA